MRTVVVTDLRPGGQRHAGAFGAGNLSEASGPLRPLSILRLRLERSGAVAWLQRDVDARAMQPVDRLLTLRAGGVRQLDLAPVGRLTDVRLRDHRLSWTRSRTQRAVRLRSSFGPVATPR